MVKYTAHPDAARARLLYGGILGLIAATDLGEDIAKALPRASIPRLPRERALLQTVIHLVATYHATRQTLQANVQRWFEALLPSIVDKSISVQYERFEDRDTGEPLYRPVDMALVKAAGPLDGPKIEELRQLVTAHFKPAPGSPTRWAIPTEMWNAWQVAGIVIPGLALPEVADAYVAGRLYQVLTQATDFDTMKRMAAQVPPPTTLALAETWARQHAGEAVRGFGERVAARVVATALSTQQRIIRDQTAAYLRDGVTADLTPKDFGRDLYRIFEDQDAERDWHRVAVAETRVAFNVGRLQAMDEDDVEQGYYLVQPDACRYCKAVYLNPDGTPKLFRISELLDTVVETGGTNIGRLASKIGDEDEGWIPNALLHPWCRCRPMPYLPGHTPLRIVG